MSRIFLKRYARIHSPTLRRRVVCTEFVSYVTNLKMIGHIYLYAMRPFFAGFPTVFGGFDEAVMLSLDFLFEFSLIVGGSGMAGTTREGRMPVSAEEISGVEEPEMMSGVAGTI
jgi:hypothetical protein